MFKGRMLNAANFVLPELAGSAVKGSLLPPARSSFYSRPPMCADYSYDFISHMMACLKVIEIACTNESAYFKVPASACKNA